MSEQPERVALSESSTLEVLDETDEARDLRRAATVSPLVDTGVGSAPDLDEPSLPEAPPPPRTYPGTPAPLADGSPVRRSPKATSDREPAGEHPLVRELLLTPGHWHIWPAVAVLRWMLRQASTNTHRLMYRSKPSLDFPPGEVEEVELTGSGVVGLTLRAPGIAAPGSPLPTADIVRIIEDQRHGGAMAAWLDGFGDRFMQAVETAQAQSNAAFALAVGGEIPTLRTVSNLIGRSATLAADETGALDGTWTKPPRGALGLAPFFLGALSAANLTDLVAAYTGLPATVTEFAGARVAVARPARIGVVSFGAMLGTSCVLAAAGVEVAVDGGSDPASLKWAREGARRQSLYRLAVAFIGGPSPTTRFYLDIDGAVVPPGALGSVQLGGVAVLGQSSDRVRLALANA